MAFGKSTQVNAAELPSPEMLLAEFRARANGDSAAALRELLARLCHAAAPASVWEQLVSALLASGDLVAAETLLEHGIHAHPGAPGLRYLLGNLLRVQGKPGAAERELRAVLSADPVHSDAASSLAFLLREQGRMGQAAAVMRGSWQHAGGGPDEARRIATFLAQCNRHTEALEVCTQTLAVRRDANLLALRGTLAMTLGRFENATADLREAVGINPKLATAWLWLALSHRFGSHDDQDLPALEAIAAAYPAESDVGICARFGLGKAWDDLDDIPAAVRVLRVANTAVAARMQWQVAKWDAFVAKQIAVPVPEPVAPRSVVPLFVVGLPRTGTTLVSTLLSRHPEVRDRGELGWLSALAEQGASQHYPRGFLVRAAELYGVQLRQDDQPARYYIDKNSFNFRFLGLAAALFPRARVIHCRRNPRDCALSNWRQYFATVETGFSYRFSDMAAVARGHDALMAHWRATLPLPIFELDYETLVSRPDETIAGLLRFLELDPGLHSRTQTGSGHAIGTASVWQARQPVHANSVGRWRAYADQLPELLDAFPDNDTASALV